jgi:hypothetical protein
MKTIIFVAGLCLTLAQPVLAQEPKKPAPTVTAPAAPADAKKDTAPAPETKKACIKTTDPKTGKEVEKCKTVTIHKKHEGTNVDSAKKDPVKK